MLSSSRLLILSRWRLPLSLSLCEFDLKQSYDRNHGRQGGGDTFPISRRYFHQCFKSSKVFGNTLKGNAAGGGGGGGGGGGDSGQKQPQQPSNGANSFRGVPPPPPPAATPIPPTPKAPGKQTHPFAHQMNTWEYSLQRVRQTHEKKRAMQQHAPNMLIRRHVPPEQRQFKYMFRTFSPLDFQLSHRCMTEVDRLMADGKHVMPLIMPASRLLMAKALMAKLKEEGVPMPNAQGGIPHHSQHRAAPTASHQLPPSFVNMSLVDLYNDAGINVFQLHAASKFINRYFGKEKNANAIENCQGGSDHSSKTKPIPNEFKPFDPLDPQRPNQTKLLRKMFKWLREGYETGIIEVHTLLHEYEDLENNFPCRGANLYEGSFKPLVEVKQLRRPFLSFLSFISERLDEMDAQIPRRGVGSLHCDEGGSVGETPGEKRFGKMFSPAEKAESYIFLLQCRCLLANMYLRIEPNFYTTNRYEGSVMGIEVGEVKHKATGPVKVSDEQSDLTDEEFKEQETSNALLHEQCDKFIFDRFLDEVIHPPASNKAPLLSSTKPSALPLSKPPKTIPLGTPLVSATRFLPPILAQHNFIDIVQDYDVFRLSRFLKTTRRKTLKRIDYDGADRSVLQMPLLDVVMTRPSLIDLWRPAMADLEGAINHYPLVRKWFLVGGSARGEVQGFDSDSPYLASKLAGVGKQEGEGVNAANNRNGTQPQPQQQSSATPSRSSPASPFDQRLVNAILSQMRKDKALEVLRPFSPASSAIDSASSTSSSLTGKPLPLLSPEEVERTKEADEVAVATSFVALMTVPPQLLKGIFLEGEAFLRESENAIASLLFELRGMEMPASVSFAPSSPFFLNQHGEPYQPQSEGDLHSDAVGWVSDELTPNEVHSRRHREEQRFELEQFNDDGSYRVQHRGEASPHPSSTAAVVASSPSPLFRDITPPPPRLPLMAGAHYKLHLGYVPKAVTESYDEAVAWVRREEKRLAAFEQLNGRRPPVSEARAVEDYKRLINRNMFPDNVYNDPNVLAYSFYDVLPSFPIDIRQLRNYCPPESQMGYTVDRKFITRYPHLFRDVTPVGWQRIQFHKVNADGAHSELEKDYSTMSDEEILYLFLQIIKSKRDSISTRDVRMAAEYYNAVHAQMDREMAAANKQGEGDAEASLASAAAVQTMGDAEALLACSASPPPSSPSPPPPQRKTSTAFSSTTIIARAGRKFGRAIQERFGSIESFLNKFPQHFQYVIPIESQAGGFDPIFMMLQRSGRYLPPPDPRHQQRAARHHNQQRRQGGGRSADW